MPPGASSARCCRWSRPARCACSWPRPSRSIRSRRPTTASPPARKSARSCCSCADSAGARPAPGLAQTHKPLDLTALVGLEPLLVNASTPPEAGGGRREERKAQNREKLLLAARKVFAEKGYGEATARDIVRETDLATGTFYNYFADKQEIFSALLDEMSEKGRALVREQRRQAGPTLEERVENAYRAYFEWAVEEDDLFEVFRRNASVI